MSTARPTLWFETCCQRLRPLVVQRAYANHRRAPTVQSALTSVLGTWVKTGEPGANVGSGGGRLHERLLNLDLAPRRGVDCACDGLALPVKSGSLGLVVTQEAVEHMADPLQAVQEMSRALRSGGVLYFQTPFVIGFHPGPADYWRFTVQGVRELLERAGLRVERLEVAVGAGTGVYRILVEFCAVVASSLWPRLYYPAKGFAAVLLQPLRLADQLTKDCPQVDRIPAGYLAVARKP